MSIKKAILDKNEGNEVEKAEYINLILDDMNIGEISEEDKQFLEGFTETQFLSLNSTSLKSLANLPKLDKLERLELNDNKIAGELELLSGLYPNLRVLKLSNNQLKTLEQVVALGKCEKLESLDLSNNPVTSIEEYAKHVREALPRVDVLDGFNREGQEVVSEDEEDEEDEEEDDEEEGDGEDEDEEEEEEGDEDEEDEEEEDGEEEDEDGEEEEPTADKSVGMKRKAGKISGEKEGIEGEKNSKRKQQPSA